MDVDVAHIIISFGSIPHSNAWNNENFAKGLRNAFTCRSSATSYMGEFEDAEDQQILCGDVGSDFYEEVDVIVGGGKNYGWSVLEGPSCNPPGSTCR